MYQEGHSFHFNPRSPEESDSFVNGYLMGCYHFNPRSPEESDSDILLFLCAKISISIHALLKRATGIVAASRED